MTTPQFAPAKEVRLAVVMYGGVSLAIYINGVAQELLKLVRATVADDTNLRFADEALTSTEVVYRRLAKIAGIPGAPHALPGPDDAVTTRFVIDVISGTSAGGINGIFLGKALSNGQSIDDLKRLWIDQGDIQVLINDKKSVEAPLALQDPPESLLNSQRMYWELLRAFNGMDRAGGQGTPYVTELDVFVTTTDIEGIVVPVRLAEGIVYERRHRNVFHFQYVDGTLSVAGSPVPNDFAHADNPFLAFASRCTSSFPFAFEPMTLRDIDAVLDLTPEFASDRDGRSDGSRWRRFYDTYVQQSGAPLESFARRSFGDGGYLDNKPFSYAVDALIKRHAEAPVERKLIYVEPAPDHPEDEAPQRTKPDALENTVAALVEIPAYETIREDLQRVLEHNRGLERVKRIISQIEVDQERADEALGGQPAGPALPTLHAGDWVRMDVAQMLARSGRSYVAYNRLKVSSVTDDLVSMFARVLSFDEDSATAQAVRCLIRAWRDDNYVQYRDGNRPTQNQFLMDFDVSYRLRRMRFVLNKIDELYRLDERAQDMLRFRKADAVPAESAQAGEFRDELTRIKRSLMRVYRRLRALERQLWAARREESPLLRFTAGLGITMDDLRALIEPEAGAPVSEEVCTRRAREYLGAPAHAQQHRALDALATQLKDFLVKEWQDPSVGEGLSRFRGDDADGPAPAARRTVRHYFDHYEDYDAVLFPILFQSDVLGEGAPVDVIRISPEDAMSLMDDRAEARKPEPLRKLAGLTLGHFGGFVEREWRKNDMMWGRLDGAERLIAAILPNPLDHATRQTLIDEAQRTIIREELSDTQRAELFDEIRAHGATPASVAYAKKILLDEKEALQDYRENLEREPNPKGAARALARSTQVVGKILEEIARRRHAESRRLALVTRLGRMFWALVEAAVPRSLPHLLFHYWLQLVYGFAVVMIAAGTFTSKDGVATTGWVVLGGAAAVNVVVALLTDYMLHSTSLLRALKIGLGLVVLALATLGGFELFRFATETGLLSWLQNVKTGHALSTSEERVRALGGLALLVGLLGGWMRRHAKTLDFALARQKTTSGIRSPLLALEVPEWSRDVRTVVGDLHDPDRMTAAELQKVDFWFIALYWLFFGGLSGLAWWRTGGGWVGYAAIAAFACATLGAIFDIVENRRILRLLGEPLPVRLARGDALQPHVDAVRHAALAKWSLIFAAQALLVFFFFVLGDVFIAVGATFVAAALVGALGVLWKRTALEVGAGIMGLGFLAVAVLLLIKPERFLMP